jgi:hypothetical protein
MGHGISVRAEHGLSLGEEGHDVVAMDGKARA